MYHAMIGVADTRSRVGHDVMNRTMNVNRIKMLFHPCVLLSLVAASLWGCGNDVPDGPGRDCSADGIGCSPGFSCVLADDGRHNCIVDEVDLDAMAPAPDASVALPDAAITEPDAMVVTPDATVEPDAALPPDGDGDGAPDSTDNCIDTANPDQADTDNDGLGDACDDEPNVQNFFMTGHFLTLGGTSVDDDHTLKSKITTGAGELTDGQLILKGAFNP